MLYKRKIKNNEMELVSIIIVIIEFDFRRKWYIIN
jgi:hypothetical protein